ncbi:hypothetical protein Gorai_005713, partial [Gossypium raimondii]|nr:hypothetical protein [Gossypium raimondii]
MEDSLVEGLIPKKIRFRDKDGDGGNDMVIDLKVEQTTSWKNKLVGQSTKFDGNGLEEEEDFGLLEGEIQKSIMNAIPSIEFSDRIHQILIRDMENIVILKFLGRNIGYSILQNKNKLDCEKVLSRVPWIVFGQYLIIQPWTVSFNLTQVFPGLLGYLYKQKILMEIKGMIGKVAKLDMNTDNRVRENQNLDVDGTVEKGESYGLWMLVERKSRRK